MNEYLYLKPKYRSKLRLFLGIRFYRFKKYCYWYLSHNKYSKERTDESLQNLIFEHSTPIYRQLKDVDMWLQQNKADNLAIALPKISGIIIRPGEILSYWKLIGNPTYAKGYKDGMILHYGKFISGVGGGLCQLSNLIYWMTIHTPLTVLERYRHSFDVFPDSNRTQPFGSGATCVYNYRDLTIKNETNESYQINLWIKDGYLHGEITSDCEKYFDYEVYEAKHKITHEYWGAYVRHNEIRRRINNLEAQLVDDSHVCENHALMMYEPFLENKSSS